MKPTMCHMQAVSEEGSRLLGGASLHVPNLDVEEGGVANDLDGNAVDLAQASAQLRVVQEKSGGEREQRGGYVERRRGRRLATRRVEQQQQQLKLEHAPALLQLHWDCLTPPCW